MTLNSLDAVFCTVAFLVPGFVIHSVMSMFVPHKVEQVHLSFLRFLTLSCWNYAFWAWLVYLIIRLQFFDNHPIWCAIAWGVIIFLGPVALGFLLGYFSQTELVRRLLHRFGFRPIHIIPTAWDYKFSKADKQWVLVTLKDGSSVAGLFGSKSFASSDPEERDLLIQEVWTVSKDGTWEKPKRNSSFFVRGEQIKHIEFWSDQKEEENA